MPRNTIRRSSRNTPRCRNALAVYAAVPASTGMHPLYLARIEDLGHGDLVKVDRAACHDVALLMPVFLLRLGLSPHAEVLDLTTRVRCRGCGAKGRAVVSIKGRHRGEPMRSRAITLIRSHLRCSPPYPGLCSTLTYPTKKPPL